MDRQRVKPLEPALRMLSWVFRRSLSGALTRGKLAVLLVHYPTSLGMGDDGARSQEGNEEAVWSR
jgi:hypothetical protein